MTDRIDHLEALDRALSGEQVDPALEPLVSIAMEARAALRLSAPTLAPTLAPALAPTAAPRLPGRRGARRLQVLLAATIVLLLTLGGSLTASASSLPGDALYPVKRAVERVALAVERDPAQKADRHLLYAERRLSELATLLQRRRSGEQIDVGAAMSAYRSEVAGAENSLRSAAASDKQIAKLQARLDAHVTKLEALAASKNNPRAAEAIRRAIDKAERAAERLAEKKANKPGKGERGRSSEAPGKR